MLCRAGLLRPLLADVFVEVAAGDDAGVRARGVAVLLPTRIRAAGAVVGHLSAAWVLAGQLPGQLPGTGAGPPTVEVLLGPGRHVGGADRVRVRQSRLAPQDVHLVAGLAVTTPARTAVDLARVLPARHLVPALAALQGSTGLQPEQVLERLAAITGARGIRRARAVLEVWAAGVSAVPPAGGPVGVEDALDPADRRDHVAEMRRVGHLEGELRDGHAVA